MVAMVNRDIGDRHERRPDELVDGATFRRVLAGLVAAYQSLDEDFAEFIDDYGE
jgi:hypothetical protein